MYEHNPPIFPILAPSTIGCVLLTGDVGILSAAQHVFTRLPLSRHLHDEQKTTNDIDESRDGAVERMEWIRYIAVLDEGEGKLQYHTYSSVVWRAKHRYGTVSYQTVEMRICAVL